MNQQPDKLFRDKLENYEKAVAPSAWDRIAPAQPSGTQNRVWLKVAASLLLVAGAGAIWMWTRSDASTSSTLAGVPSTMSRPSVSATAEEVPAPEKAVSNVEAASHTLQAEATMTPKAQPSTRRSGHRRTTHSNQLARVDAQMNGQAGRYEAAGADYNDATTRTSPEPASLTKESLVSSTEPTGVDKTLFADGHPVAVDVAAERVSQGVTLTYSAKEVSAYLDKNFDGDATDDDKKQSTLKKLLQKANDLKTNQDTFGELRQRKNEILALNFKNDKRGQKTRN